VGKAKQDQIEWLSTRVMKEIEANEGIQRILRIKLVSLKELAP
jgi:hypothetical protein